MNRTEIPFINSVSLALRGLLCFACISIVSRSFADIDYFSKSPETTTWGPYQHYSGLHEGNGVLYMRSKGPGEELSNAYARGSFSNIRVKGDFEIELRFYELVNQNYYIGGIMLRNTLDERADQSAAFMLIRGYKLSFRIQNVKNQAYQLVGSNTPHVFPTHLRLKRRGDMIETYYSTDPAANGWTLFETAIIENL